MEAAGGTLRRQLLNQQLYRRERQQQAEAAAAARARLRAATEKEARSGEEEQASEEVEVEEEEEESSMSPGEICGLLSALAAAPPSVPLQTALIGERGEGGLLVMLLEETSRYEDYKGWGIMALWGGSGFGIKHLMMVIPS